MKICLLLTLLFLSMQHAFPQSEVQRQKHFNVKRNAALEGYDAVSYFEGKPLKGSDDHIYDYKGIRYQFASISNVNKFKSNPEKYEPAYGGWCAYAMGETGEKVKVDPETYKIVNGKLYLFYNFWGNNTLADWNKNEMKLKDAGDRNWKKNTQ
jgi:YHS domain-containing protein